LVDVDGEARVSRAIGTREFDSSRAGRAISDNVNLETARVELSSSSATSSMESDDLGTDQVVPRCDIGNGERPFAAVVVKDLDSPVHRIVRNQPGFVDFEPGGRGCVGGLCVAHSSHVDHDRSVVLPTDGLISALTLTGLLVHLDSNLVSRLDGTDLWAVLGCIAS